MSLLLERPRAPKYKCATAPRSHHPKKFCRFYLSFNYIKKALYILYKAFYLLIQPPK